MLALRRSSQSLKVGFASPLPPPPPHQPPSPCTRSLRRPTRRWRRRLAVLAHARRQRAERRIAVSVPAMAAMAAMAAARPVRLGSYGGGHLLAVAGVVADAGQDKARELVLEQQLVRVPAPQHPRRPSATARTEQRGGGGGLERGGLGRGLGGRGGGRTCRRRCSRASGSSRATS